MTTMTHSGRVRKSTHGVVPYDEHDEPGRASVLPRVDGSGLTQDEAFRLNRAANTARAQYAADCPEADSIEVHRVGAAAAADALRAVLRDRPAAPCCDSLEEAPCLGCSDHHIIPGADPEMTPDELADLAELNRTNPAGAVEVDPARYPAYLGWPGYTANWRWHETPARDPEPRLTLAELIDSEAARMRRMGTDAGDLMAGALTELSRVVRLVDASRPDQVEERLSILERDYTDPAFEFAPEPELMPSGRWA